MFPNLDEKWDSSGPMREKSQNEDNDNGIIKQLKRIQVTVGIRDVLMDFKLADGICGGKCLLLKK